MREVRAGSGAFASGPWRSGYGVRVSERPVLTCWPCGVLVGVAHGHDGPVVDHGPGHVGERHRPAQRPRSWPAAVTGKPGYLVYWDQNEEEDFVSMPSGTQGQLLPAWDPNGQMCLLPDGRFVVRLRPHAARASTTWAAPSPTSSPPTARSSTSPTARSAGRPCTCPGPTRCRARASAATRPRLPTACSTTTRPTPGAPSTRPATCSATTSPRPRATTRRPSSGRLVEWFAPNYTTYCIVYGPTSGGYGPAPHRRLGRAWPSPG